MSELRGGLTTGTCAAGAAKAAAWLLLRGEALREVEVGLPDGQRVRIPLLYAREEGAGAVAAVRKDAGDDPDVTHGATVVAAVVGDEGGEILFRAGEGVGTVTKLGLTVPPGEPAINPGPRAMIREAIREITERGVVVTLSIPGGRELAARTFNPRLGIKGGLSILGTSGRVRPFSVPALRVSLRCALDVAAAGGVTAPVLVPGHIGEKAARRHFRLNDEQVIEVGNEWGFMLDCAAAHPFKGLLALGHPGKLAKLAAAEWDTHSSRSAGAVPRVAALAAKVLGRAAPPSATVEGLFASLAAAEQKKLGDALAGRIRAILARRLPRTFAVAAVLVDMKGNWLGGDGEMGLWK